MSLKKQIFSGSHLLSVLNRLAVLEDKARDEYFEFIHECLRKRRKKNRIETEKEQEIDLDEGDWNEH